MKITVLLPNKDKDSALKEGSRIGPHISTPPSLISTLKILHPTSSGEQSLEMTVTLFV